MKPIKTARHFLFTHEDELRFSLSIKERYPEAGYIDGLWWPGPTPPTRPLLSDCREGWAYLWNPVFYPVLPGEYTRTGWFRGPAAGPVIQIERSVISGRVMYSGDIMISSPVHLSELPMIEFSHYVWKMFRRCGVLRAMQIDALSRAPIRIRTDILVGTDAAAWCLASEDRYFEFHNSPGIFMRPVNEHVTSGSLHGLKP